MAVERMVRNASDNKYLHRDFHNILNLGIEYLRVNYGEESVKEYLRQFTNAFYAPLKERIASEGLGAVKEHFSGIYEAEEALDVISFEGGMDELTIHVARCPAVSHMRASGVEASPAFAETTRVIGEALCEGTPYVYELISYNDADGASAQRFRRKG